MYLGCAWYPEHWEEERWAEDLRLMRQAGMNVVRVGEFAWSRLEPEAGRYELDWLERAVALAAAHGLETVIGTPTAPPPAWLTQQHPEVLARRENGRLETHGARCHFSPTSTVYLGFCRRVAEAMARRFGANPHVIGWQIDNEYSSLSFDDNTRLQFENWLRLRYETLDNLNAHWSTAYWSQEYSDWSQIPLPAADHNPGLRLEFQRFCSYVYRTYQREQLEPIRAHAEARQWITSNFMGWFDRFDHYEVCEELDLASWDNYVGTGHLNFLENGAPHDLTRGFKRRNFWLMETQPGSVNWSPVNNALDRGEVRTMAWHAVGHGADAVLYWQWRSALNGQEQYHGTLVAPDGRPRPLYAEVARIGVDFQRASAALQGTVPLSEVAMLHSYDDRWAINFQRHHQDFDPVRHLLGYYRPLRAAGFGVDIVHPMAPLEAYRLVIAPHLHILTQPLVDHLCRFVNAGGHLVLGPRSGMKDIYNALLPARQPGPLAASLGAHVEEYYALERPIPVAGTVGEGEAQVWAEWLQLDAPAAVELLHYGAANGWLDGQPAMVTHRVRSGRLTYIGAWLSDDLMNRVTEWLTQASGLEPLFGPLPEGVEVCRRASEESDVFIVINHSSQTRQVPLPRKMRNLLTDLVHSDYMELPSRRLAVFQVETER